MGSESGTIHYMPDQNTQTETELRAQIARMEAVLKDADNIPQSIAELLRLITERRHVEVPLALTLDGKPHILTPRETQALAGALYHALVQELGITAKLLDLDRENQSLRAQGEKLFWEGFKMGTDRKTTLDRNQAQRRLTELLQ